MFVSQPAGKPPALHTCTILAHAFYLLYVGYFDGFDNFHTAFFSILVHNASVFFVIYFIET